MTKAVTGTIHKTTFGLFLIPDDQSIVFSVGDSISFNSQVFTVIGIVSPTRPNGKWSLKVIQEQAAEV